jgi:hypothetical protein
VKDSEGPWKGGRTDGWKWERWKERRWALGPVSTEKKACWTCMLTRLTYCTGRVRGEDADACKHPRLHKARKSFLFILKV